MKAVGFRLALAAALAGLGGCNPADAVLSVAFLLGPPPPSEARFLPPADELGVDPTVLANASGRCDIDVTTAVVACNLKGLPQLAPTAEGKPRAYELRLILGDGPTPPRTNAASVERYPGTADPGDPRPMKPEKLPRAVLGVFGADAFGNAVGTFTSAEALDRTLGGELMLKSPQPDGTIARFLVIDGRVGNVPVTTSAAPAATSGHHH